jgi:stage II sporulation protein D
MKHAVMRMQFFLRKRLIRRNAYCPMGKIAQVTVFGMLGAAAVLTVAGAAATYRQPQNVKQTPEPVLEVETEQSVLVESAETTVSQVETKGYDDTHIIRFQSDDGTVMMTLEDYLTGVVAAEMPASFEPEALKAQAAAARTFTLKQIESGKHGGAICGDAACCQAYLDAGEREARFGTDAVALEEKVRTAVQETDGVVVTYDGDLIDAVYFSSAAGRTEDAAEVWGGGQPYLVSVDSPENALDSEATISVPLDTFCQTILEAAPEADLSGNPAAWFGEQTETAGEGVQMLEIGGIPFRGVDLRQMFSLRSTQFTIAITADAIEFETVGYGHRVGMSQYGANTMAAEGADYQGILTHYYTGTEIKTLF